MRDDESQVVINNGNNHKGINLNNVSQTCLSESLGGLVKSQRATPFPWVSISVGLGWSPKISISSKFSGEVDATGPGTIL